MKQPHNTVSSSLKTYKETGSVEKSGCWRGQTNFDLEEMKWGVPPRSITTSLCLWQVENFEGDGTGMCMLAWNGEVEIKWKY